MDERRLQCEFFIPIVRNSDKKPHQPVAWNLLVNEIRRVFPAGHSGPETLDVIRNSNSLPFQPPLPVLNAEVVQPTSRFHGRIRISLFGVPENILHDAAAFHAGQGMLDFDPHTCQLPVRALLSGREFSAAWLFFSAGRFP